MNAMERFLVDPELDWKSEVDTVVQEVCDGHVAPFARRVMDASDPAVLERGLHACAVAGTSSSGFRTAFVEEVPVSELVSFGRRFLDDVTVQKKFMYLMSVLAACDSIREQLVEGGAAEIVLAVTRAHMDNDVVLERACMALSRLALCNEENRRRIGGLKMVRDILDRNRSNKALSLTSSLSIRNMTQTRENALLATEFRIPELLIDVAKEYDHDVQVQTHLLMTLVAMNQVDEEVARAIGGNRQIVTPIVKLVEASEHSKQLSEISVELLARVAAARDQEVLEKLGNSGIVTVLGQRLEKYGDDAILAAHACTVLRGLTLTSRSREVMRTDGGIVRVIQSLQVHANDSKVVVPALYVLANACHNSTENQEMIGKSGGIEVTLKAMDLHRDKAYVQECGCRCLRNYADNCEYNIRVEGDRGVVKVLAMAMMGFPNNTGVNEQAVAALLNLAKFEQNVVRMVDTEIREVVRVNSQVIGSDDLTARAKKLLGILEASRSPRKEQSKSGSTTRVSRTSSPLQRTKAESTRDRGSRIVNRPTSAKQNGEKKPNRGGTTWFSRLRKAVSARGAQQGVAR